MADAIVNRVAKSGLLTFDLEALYPKGQRQTLDISQWLYEGLVLREQAFRAALKQEPWENFTNQYVALHCSTEAIIPAWAFLLVSNYLLPYVKMVVVGSLNDLETQIFNKLLQNIDFSPYNNKAVIIKGCSKKPVPENAYVQAFKYLQPIAKSVMYGEACSAVPLYKKPR